MTRARSVRPLSTLPGLVTAPETQRFREHVGEGPVHRQLQLVHTPGQAIGQAAACPRQQQLLGPATRGVSHLPVALPSDIN